MVLGRIASRCFGTEANRCGLSFGEGSGDQTTPEAATSPAKIIPISNSSEREKTQGCLSI
ncbi:hypothetical protein DY000_02003744 [Brassica cretica]|uniref:Uncharacterized protein n=1 Tax=Brassica cretica TaxID=69181 RepID=A0ABQ7C4E4_BRACR|nr:hypothetical protein DY000_02003744 [Brassica cretica]